MPKMDTRPNASLQRLGTSTRATVDRIVKVYERSTADQRADGAAWYGDGESIIADLADRSGLSREHVAAVVSHLSPRTTWTRNVYGATMLVTTGTAPTCAGDDVDRCSQRPEGLTAMYATIIVEVRTDSRILATRVYRTRYGTTAKGQTSAHTRAVDMAHRDTPDLDKVGTVTTSRVLPGSIR
jgi:hypothetical protein